MARIDSELLNYNSKYKQGDVLENKLGIDSVEKLDQAERMITTFKLSKLYLDPGTQTFDANHYISIHKFLFEDIYPFAGEIRQESISKRIPFCLPQYIYPELDRTLKNAIKKIPVIDNRDKLLRFITELYSDLDIIHPFREGNGRTEREFLRQFIDYICKVNNLEPYTLDYSKIEDKNALVEALVNADALLDYRELLMLFNNILVVKDNNLNKEDIPKLS